MAFFDQNYRQLEAKYLYDQRMHKLLELFRKTWPNIGLQITYDQYTHYTCVWVIIDGEQHKVVTIERLDSSNDVVVYNAIVTYLTNLKQVKRKLIMKELLTVKDV